MPSERKIADEFHKILTAKDCAKYSKTAKDNYEDAISKMTHTLNDIERKLENGEYTRHQPDIDKSVVDFYNKVIDSYIKAVDNFVKTGNWSISLPQVSEKTKRMFDDFMVADTKYGSYFDGRPDMLDKVFAKVVKNMTKNNFSPADLSAKKAEEEEAKKPKLPDKVEYTRFESYDSKRMRDYKTNSRGEQMAHTAFCDKRARQFSNAKYYKDKYPILMTYLSDIFNAFDNAWFSFISGTTDKVDFTEVDSIYNKYVEEYPVVKSFDNKVCGQRMAYGGCATIWDCKDAMYKMENNRNKVVKAVTMEKEDTYSKWERSVDAILNEDGKPSLNAYLDNWVEEVVAYYTNTENVKKCKTNDTRLKKEINELQAQIDQMAKDWFETHKSDRVQSWRFIRDGYQDTEEYRPLNSSLKSKKAIKADNDRELSIANMGEAKIREMFKQQAASAKKSFVTAVCEKAGILKSGVFYWSVQHTGHLNGTVVGEDGSKWRVTSFFAGGWNVQVLHSRTKITKLVK